MLRIIFSPLKTKRQEGGPAMLRLPVQVQLEITDICNLRCKHCYHFDTDNMPKSNDLSDEDTLQLIQKLIGDRIYSLIVTGGEPLARPSMAIKTTEIAKKAGMYVSINTNLSLLTSKMLSKFKELKVNSFLVSCPASDPDIYKNITRCGDYNRFRLKLKMLLDSNISCLVNMVVSQANYQFVRSTATDMAKLGVKRFAVTPAVPNVEHPDFDSLLSKHQIITLFEDLKWCVDTLAKN